MMATVRPSSAWDGTERSAQEIPDGKRSMGFPAKLDGAARRRRPTGVINHRSASVREYRRCTEIPEPDGRIVCGATRLSIKPAGGDGAGGVFRSICRQNPLCRIDFGRPAEKIPPNLDLRVRRQECRLVFEGGFREWTVRTTQIRSVSDCRRLSAKCVQVRRFRSAKVSIVVWSANFVRLSSRARHLELHW